MLFSNTTYSFYEPTFDYNNLPEDVVEVPDYEYQKFLDGGYGSSVSFDTNSKKLCRRVLDTVDQKVQLLRYIKGISKGLLEDSDKVILRAYEAGATLS